MCIRDSHNGENGFVCQDVNGFVEAIRSIQRENAGQSFENSESAASVYPKAEVGGEIVRLVQNAYVDIMKKYNTRVMAEKYSKIYSGKRS